MSNPSWLAPANRDSTGIMVTGCGMLWQHFTPRHSLSHDLAYVVLFAGAALRAYGSYLFAPVLLCLAAMLVFAGPKPWWIAGDTLIAVSLAVGLSGWWKDKKAKAAAKKLAGIG